MARGRKDHAAVCSKHRRKVRYRSWNDAKVALAAVRIGAELRGRTTAPVRVYECAWCGGWHLTAMTVDEYEEMREAWGN